jgi:hypothetical protein
VSFLVELPECCGKAIHQHALAKPDAPYQDQPVPQGRPTVRVKGSTHPGSLSCAITSIPRPGCGQRATRKGSRPFTGMEVCDG